MVERFNRTLEECIAKLVSNEGKEWDNFVDAVLFAYRTKKHKTTGFTPFYLIYGRQATLPIELKIPGDQELKEDQDPLLARLYHLIEKLENDRQKARDQIARDQHKQKE
jgi:hypothetical protein